jgi:hypothetical protein
MGKEVGARGLPVDQSGNVPQQICFVFDTPCLLGETDGGLAVTVDRKEAPESRLTIRLKKAG